LNFVLQALLALCNMIGNELSDSGSHFDEMISGLVRLICTSKPKIRSAASKTLQKALSTWPADTKEAISRTDDDWRTNELVQKLLVSPLSSSAAPSVRQSDTELVETVSQSIAVTDSVARDGGLITSTAAMTSSSSSIDQLSSVTSRVSNIDDMVVGKSTISSTSNLSNVDMYGADASSNPFSPVLDLLNSYVSAVKVYQYK
jgi:hypothetical protein